MQNIKQIQKIYYILLFFQKTTRMRKHAWKETHIQAGGVRTRRGTMECANALIFEIKVIN